MSIAPVAAGPVPAAPRCQPKRGCLLLHRSGWARPLLLMGAALVLPAAAQVLPLSDRDIAIPAHWYLTVGEPGLYPGGLNVPSGAHLAYGQAQTALVRPLASASVTGSAPAVGFVAVGMSNTNQEWGRFAWRMVSGAQHGARVVLVDAGQGGTGAAEMDEASEPYWAYFDQRVAAAGLGLDQVQGVWLKQSLAGGGSVFPGGADTLRQSLAGIVGVLTSRCPNLRVIYLSSRIWGGNEPRNFETAFAVKWLIEDQVDRIGLGTETGPWLAWGPYLWADGLNPRSDGLFWDPAIHLEPDLTHPSAGGEEQVATLLSNFLDADELAASWFSPVPGSAPRAIAASDDAYVDAAQPTTTFGADSQLRWATGTRIYVRFDLTGLPSSGVERARLSLRLEPDNGVSVGALHTSASSGWSEGSLTFASAPALGVLVRTFPSSSRGGILDLDVTPQVQAALANGDGAISFVLVPPANVASPGAFLSRESGEGPQLLLTGPAMFADGFESGTTEAWSLTVP